MTAPLLVLSVSGLCGCTPTGSTAALRTAHEAVATYFRGVGAHRCSQAAISLRPQLRSGFLYAPDSDCNNTLGVEKVSITVSPAPFAKASYPGYTEIQQATVSYDATHRQVFAAQSGHQFRFIYVGRQGSVGPWEILEIGTGP